ncbi:MAG: hypothetical protein OXC10_06630 [Rhodospirillaceae bacterium]|nr:hypothetical protein [Rhodospirillaceae bacterium]
MAHIAFTEWQGKAAALRLKRSGGELKGPCPACGGKDRFSVKKGRDGRALIYCRHCDPGQRNPDAFKKIMEAAGFDLDPAAPRRPPKPSKPVRRIVPANDEPAAYTAQMEALRLHTSKGTAKAADSPFRHPAVRKADDG